MSDFKCAIIGVSGGRARGHAEAYSHTPRGQLVAVSSRQADKLNAFADQFSVAGRYTDYREMFAQEQPDVVHVNTPPDVRVEVMVAAEAAGIPALIVEKPLAIQGEDFRAIRAFAEGRPRLKVAINHQLHFHPRRQALQKMVAAGALGTIRFIDASAGMNLAYQGTHSLQAIGAFMPDARPTQIFATVTGAAGLAENPRQHYAPDGCAAAISYDNGVEALLRCGENAPRVEPEAGRPIHQHKRIAVYGTRGFLHWTMWGWEMGISGVQDGGSHAYPDEDILGQAAMTEAMFDWLLDDSALHPLNIDTALVDFNTVLSLYTSAIERRPVALPLGDPADGLVDALRGVL